MFQSTEEPKIGLNIYREVKRVPSLDVKTKCCGDLGDKEITFDVKLTGTAETDVEFLAELVIYCGTIVYIHIKYPFHFRNIEHVIDNDKLMEMCRQMFDYLVECFIDYSQEERNANMPKIVIGTAVMEKFLASSNYENLPHSLKK